MNQKLVSKSNYVLRKVINKEECIDILQNFIESILDIKIKKISLNSYLTKKEKNLPKEENFGIADLRIRTDENEEINIGIQFVDGKYIETKLLIYYSQIHANQLEYEDRREVARTVTINMLDFNYFNSTDYQKKIKIVSNDVDIQMEELEIITIELPKFKIENTDYITPKEEWLEFLKGDNEEMLEIVKTNNKKIKKLDHLLEDYWNKEKME